MQPRIAQISEQFSISTNLVIRAVRGVDAESLMKRPGDRSNSLIWIAGHLTHTRGLMLGLLGEPRELPWGDLFRTGSALVEPQRYPSGEDVLAAWDETSHRLTRRLDELTESELDAPPSGRVPSTDGTLSGTIAFFAFHEAYHVGQLGYVRKWLGLSALVEG